MSHTVSLFTPDDEETWDDFVATCPTASFFHKIGWKSVIENTFKHQTYFLTAKRDGLLEGVMPLTHVKSRLFGNALISNAFCVGGGPAFLNDEAQTALLAKATQLLSDVGADHLELRNFHIEGSDWKYKDNLYANFSKEIEKEEDDNLKQIPRKQRAVVRKALKNDALKSQIDEGIANLYPLYAQSVRNLGTPVFAKKYFTALKETFKENCEILTVTAEGTPVASVMSFYFGKTVLPYYTGSAGQARRLGANDLMYWAVMRRAVARGCTQFDFGRSKFGTGPFSFKKNWGFEPHPITHSFLLKPGAKLPDVNPLNPKYKLFIAAWQRLPLPIANAIGPLIVRNIG